MPQYMLHPNKHNSLIAYKFARLALEAKRTLLSVKPVVSLWSSYTNYEPSCLPCTNKHFNSKTYLREYDQSVYLSS